MEGAPDTDVTARVRILPADPDLIVEISLRDGRSTIRRVRDPAALTPTLEALLSLPPAEKQASEQPPQRAEDPSATTRGFLAAEQQSPAPAPPRDASAASEKPRPPAEDTATPSPHGKGAESTPQSAVRMELGGAAGGRVAGHRYLSFAPGGFAQLRVESLLFGVTARWDAVQGRSSTAVPNFEMDTLAVGVSVGRRWSEAPLRIDVGVSPRLIAETQSYQANPAAPSEATEQAATQTDLRLGAFARIAFGRGAFRPLLELDAELSPSRLRRDIRIDPVLPPLPSWSAGISAGVAWGEP
jgi:hypothetical protein